MSEKLHTTAALTNSSSYLNRFFSGNGNSYNLKISEAVTCKVPCNYYFTKLFGKRFQIRTNKIDYFKIVRLVMLILKIRISPRKTLSPNVS